MIPILLVVTATFRPPAPTVGDLITINFQQRVTLDKSPQYEIVSQRGSRAVIRTFEPRPFTISGRVGDVLFRNMTVPVHSVLKPRDGLAPAPLKPPIAEPYPQLPFVLIGVAALLAIGAWIAVILLDRHEEISVPVAPPAERFRSAVAAARSWAQLADAVREYIDATTLTTTEVLARFRGGPPSSAAAVEDRGAPLIAEILRQGDLEKFSPWGPRPGDLRALKKRALELIPEEREEAAA
ncbi:MAG: hypothetical protein DMF58_14165 [Acidobacteria bacterium]|nr:MAG: hypothetical protein DMF58_14165 [Acidobacteriota bacterium]